MRQYKVHERNRQAKIDVVTRNLIQLRGAHSPNRKSSSAFVGLSLAPEERHLRSQTGFRNKSMANFN